MSIEDNKQLVERRQEVWNTGDVDRVDELFADDYIGHFPDDERRGGESVRQFMKGMREAFPDAEINYEITVIEENMVAVLARFRGTHRGKFGELEPTGRQVETTNMFFSRIENGKFTEEWVLLDTEGMMAQLNAGPKAPRIESRLFGGERRPGGARR